MDHFEREFRFRRRINYEAIIAFVVGVVIAYLIQRSLQVGSALFTTLVVVAVGGAWYHIRRVV